MADDGFTKLSERLIHQGPTLRYVEATFRAPAGQELHRELVRHPGAVSVVALHDDGTVVLERQFRAALGRALLEIPAGKRDVPSEPPEETARRELAEEVGLAAADWTKLAEFHNSPGFCDEHSTVFLARRLTAVPSDAQGVEEQEMEVVRVPLVDVPSMIASGELADAKSIIGLLLALRHLGA